VTWRPGSKKGGESLTQFGWRALITIAWHRRRHHRRQGATKRQAQSQLHARIRAACQNTVLAEGPRGSLQTTRTEKINSTISSADYSIGVKECGTCSPDASARLRSAPLAGRCPDMYGGGWIYGLANNRLSIGLVIGPNTQNRNSIPTKPFDWKTHPS